MSFVGGQEFFGMFPGPHEDDILVTGDPLQPINNDPLYGEILEVLGAFLLNPLLRKKSLA